MKYMINNEELQIAIDRTELMIREWHRKTPMYSLLTEHLCELTVLQSHRAKQLVVAEEEKSDGS